MKPAPTPANEAARLRRLCSMELLDTAGEAVLDSLTQLASRVTGLPIALISLADTDRVWFKSAVGVQQGGQTPRAVSFCSHAIVEDGIFEIEDARVHPDFSDNPLVTGPPHVVHYAGAPLEMPTGERVGVLCLVGHKPGRLAPRERELLSGLAVSVVQALVLRESDRKLRRSELMGLTDSLAQLSPVGIFAVDADGAVAHGNDRWVRLLGMRELLDGLGWGWTDFVHPDDLPALRAQWESAVRHRRPLDCRIRTHPAHRPDGWLRLRFEPASLQHGAGAGAFVGAVMDVSETARLEAALSERNELLESVIAHLPSGLAVFDAQLRHVVSNRRLNELLDLPDRLLREPGRGFDDLARFSALRGDYGPGDPQALAAQRVARARSRQAGVTERAGADGAVVEVRVATMPNHWQVRVYTDVTTLRRAEKDAHENAQRLALALEAGGLGLWEFMPLSGQLSLSESWAVFFGYAPHPRVVAAGQMAELMPGYVIEEWQRQLKQLLKGEIALLHYEHELRNARGEPIWVVSRAQVTDRDEHGRATRVVGTTKDVTLRHNADDTLRESVDTANAANRAKADFLANMSHEIRTPINGVIGLAHMLEDSKLPPKEAGYVRMINSCANTLLGLVNEVLDFSKIEAGQMALDVADTDLHALVAETADIFHARAAQTGVTFKVRMGCEVPRWIVCDGHRLRQILLNLLGNALKFTLEGGFALQVDVTAADGGARALRFDVTDTGIGISPEGIERIFNRFAQADASTTRRFQGTGLGLAISRDLAALMGGDVTVSSTLGAGSKFSLVTPLVEGTQPAAPPTCAMPETSAPRDLPILLVEDNAINQLVAKSLLAKLGYTRVTTTDNGMAALEACKRQQFALVLMDCHMPVMDGFEATRELRKAGFQRPIIALTAGAATDDRGACLRSGMDDYLAKPIDAALLAAAMRRWLHEASAVSHA